jgi:hypothetical protein
MAHPEKQKSHKPMTQAKVDVTPFLVAKFQTAAGTALGNTGNDQL